MGDFESIGAILGKPKKWQPPEKEIRKCRFCNSVMIAEKKVYQGFVEIGKTEERFSYIYTCPKRCAEKWEMRKKYQERYRKAKEIWIKAGFTREGIGWNIQKLTCENSSFIRTYAKNFSRFSKALILKGYQGTGKSLSSECIAKYLTHKGFRTRITNMSEINLELNKALRQDKYKEYLKSLLDLDLIVIDDFGREQYTTEKSLENVFQFFNALTKERKPYIVSTNPEMLAIIAQKPQLSACLDRFRNTQRVTVLEFKGRSFRK